MSAEEVAASTPERHAIGISFGNSHSSIANTGADGKPEVIANEEGDRQIPSILSYVSGEEFHGTQAKAQLVRNPKNTVAYFRDFLGKDFKQVDPTSAHASAHPQQHESTVAFSIHDSESETPNTVTVSEITTRHIRRLASSASEYLGYKVNAAVVTVPTDFSDKQRAALTEAAKAAGVDVLQFIHEPVAAVLAYDARPEAKVSDKIVVVADLGGTRSDVAVIASRGGLYTILATAHDPELGGSKLDQVLIDHFAKEFVKKHKTDPRENARSLAKLKLESEATKKALSLGTTATLSVESLAEGIDFSATINRTRYELLSSKVFGEFRRLIETAVSKAQLDLLDIDEVILSGGSSHTPKIASVVGAAFPETTTVLAPSTSTSAINPSELAVRGASIQASLIEGFEHEDIEQSTHPVVTVAPHLNRAIGALVISAEEHHGIFRPLLEPETAVPARRTAQFATPKEGGDVLIKIVEAAREIHSRKPEPKPKADEKKDDDDEEDDVSDFTDSEDEEEEIREKKWKVHTVLAEAAIKATKKGSKVEVVINVGSDLGIQITAREVGAQGGVRGSVEKPATAVNGSA
ncbi:heat shock protein 70 [Xylona heveae TC161]|uniref:Heat shock protein 70 n=1 Tax=Xylona heveae (strain CBS 132557 / TC161) TaxID=1328760 RepID=A0A164ZLS9_XYLHT|nr:heat shock protein 70 [Xylona heveae TC161]KZF19255.1 heat shock protein 70 [Xylona heveae TC161]